MLQHLSLRASLKWRVLLWLVTGLFLFIVLPSEQVSAASITITPPLGKIDFSLAVNTANQNLVVNGGSITSTDVTTYNVTAVDALLDSKGNTNAGYMVEWTGSAWTSTKIAERVKVGSGMSIYGQAPAYLNNNGGDAPVQINVINGAPATNTDLQIIVTIDTTSGDIALDAGHWYKIVITFTASQVT